jgi:DNA-binding MarR family transcriptional regulator
MSRGAVAKQNSIEHPMAKHLGYVLKRAQQALRYAMDERLGTLGLTTSQYNVLSSIHAQPGISNASLSRAAFTTAQSMLGIVSNLEKLGLMRRIPDPNHGRVKRSALTPAGEKVLTKAHKALAGVEETMTAGFTEKETEALTSMLQRCADNMDFR